MMTQSAGPGYVLRSGQSFQEPVDRLFDFFCSPANLERITPGWLNFRILPPSPTDVTQGTRIAYRIRLYGVPMNWLTEITAWQPPGRFVDTQVAGPYKRWVHEHVLKVENGLTVMEDTVRFLSAGPSLLLPTIHRMFVNPRVQAIFNFRQQCLRELFRCHTMSPVTIERETKGLVSN
ncbi:CDP-paratose 2-epimerase [Phycisphaerales bacterium AB-hyl4]|uniref:CDP-paratose 2-epimerase n=1 Tax=Natronomicrosphaera hydrolytica TaxID=3242702 RepID=A0ABV4U0Z6_9BACT